MGSKGTVRKAGTTAGRPGDLLASAEVAKVTLRLASETARRLAVESAMSGESQSSIAERVLAAYLKGWRLPSKVGPVAAVGAESADPAE